MQHKSRYTFTSSDSLVIKKLLYTEYFFFHFSVGFRTTPMDSTGVSHILEHTALCGSQRYPVRDPFFKMLNRSLSTFMNAFTGIVSVVSYEKKGHFQFIYS